MIDSDDLAAQSDQLGDHERHVSHPGAEIERIPRRMPAALRIKRVAGTGTPP
jgi:hypothetical protein